jgi:RimJ/RimL family protein N-acetyltransferase
MPEDFDDLFEFYSDPQVARFQFWGPYSAEQVERLIEEQEEHKFGDPGVPLYFAAVDSAEQKLIGDCPLTIISPDDRQGEIGFSFNPKYTGRGLATRAVNIILGIGFVRLGLHRIIACTDVRNERSWQLMERVGMRREAHFLHDCVVKDEWVDDYVYAILDDEWLGRNAELIPLLQ